MVPNPLLDIQDEGERRMPIEKSDSILGGMPHIAGTRIGVHHIVTAWRDRDLTMEEIANRVYPHLSEQEVREAVVYAFEHRDEYDRLLEEHEERRDELVSNVATGPGDLDLQESM
jgi:uncharacterized protein (DUF433 family)